MCQLAGVEHLALTVTDLDRSLPWYLRVLDLREVARGEDPELGLRSVMLRAPGAGCAIVLVQHSHTERSSLERRYPGLDHVAFKVGSRAELLAWQHRLEAYGVPYSPACPSRTFPGSEVLALRDPDGIQLEIWADAD